MLVGQALEPAFFVQANSNTRTSAETAGTVRLSTPQGESASITTAPSAATAAAPTAATGSRGSEASSISGTSVAALSLFPGPHRLERPAPIGEGVDGDERQRRDQREGCSAQTAAPSDRPTLGVCCRADDDDKEVEYFAKSLLVLLHTLQRELLVIGRGSLCWEKGKSTF